MGRVLTNNVSMSYSIESALGVAGTTWTLLEPNGINAFGSKITTTARDPISRLRQRRKGAVTDLDSDIEFEHDMTMAVVRDFIEGFCFASAVNKEVTRLSATAAETTGDTFTGMTALTAGQAAKLAADTLVWVKGGVSANDGLKSVATDAAATDTSLAVNENLTDDTSAYTISFAGYRVAAAATSTWTWDATNKIGTLASAGVGTALQARGLTVGQTAHIGSIASAGGAVQNAYENAAANDMYGYARVKSISADAVVFDKVAAALQYTDATSPATDVDVVFGEFIRNVAVGSSDYLERSFQFELESPNLGTGGASQYEYSKGNYCNTMKLSLPLTDKATITFGFTGTDTDVPTATQKTGADSAASPDETAALSTTSDIARLRILGTDEAGLSTDFKSLDITLNNNVSPEKVLGTLGAKYMNTGNFEVDLDSKLLFTNPDVVAAIRNNETVGIETIVHNDDGVVAFDFPSQTLGDGARDFPVNESVQITVKGESFNDAVLGTSIGVSLFPLPLTTSELA